MKITINRFQFREGFKKMERDNHFSYDGLNQLYEFLTEVEESMECELDYDVIALCCDYTEYDNLKEFQNDYGEEYESMEDVQNETVVIPIDNDSFIIQQF